MVRTRGRQKNPNTIPRFRKNESQSQSQKFSNSFPVPIPKFSDFNPKSQKQKPPKKSFVKIKSLCFEDAETEVFNQKL